MTVRRPRSAAPPATANDKRTIIDVDQDGVNAR